MKKHNCINEDNCCRAHADGEINRLDKREHGEKDCCGNEHAHDESECGCAHANRERDNCCCGGHEHGKKDHCGGEHEHGCGCEHGGGKSFVKRLIVSALIFAAAFALKLAGVTYGEVISKVLFIISYITAGYDVMWRSVKNISKGQIFDENLLMTIASIGAVLIGDYPEGAAVMLFYQLGEMIEHMAVDKSEHSIEALLGVRSESANVMRGGEIIAISPTEVKKGETIIVKNGERVPLDGIVKVGESELDTSAITGESIPRYVREGSEAVSGSINTGNVLEIEVTKEYSESTVSKILDFAEKSRTKKPVTEKFIKKFSKYYTPAVVALAATVALVPPFFDGFAFAKWVHRALVFLVVSCPCALIISVPLGFFAAMGASSKHGVLIKGGEYIEWLAKLNTIVFDKTGTLTKGVFEVKEITGDSEKVLDYAACCESCSNHPIAKAILAAYGKMPDMSRIKNYEEIPGMGVRAVVDGSEILAGNRRLLEKYGIEYEQSGRGQVFVVRDGECIGSIYAADTLKPEAAQTAQYFKKCGIKTAMLTGDRLSAAEEAADEAGIEIVKSDLLPYEKVKEFERLDGVKAFVGDGINDAPVLLLAHVGFAMGALGSDIAVEAADAVIMSDELSRLTDVHRISKRAMVIIKENIIFSIAVKLIVMLLSFIGVPYMMWFAVFADVGTALAAVANSMRILYLP